MLTNLTIRNLVLVEALDLDFSSGMTALTGETGAGKSILLGALQLALGSRAQADLVRNGAERLEVHASFDISNAPAAREWLTAQECDDEDQCILGRTVNREGRSKALINGRPVTLASLRALGERLIDIHGQHEHHALMQRSAHRELLDASAGLTAQRNALDALARGWRRLREEIESLEKGPDAADAQAELLRYQVAELDQLALGEEELTQLEAEHRNLCGAEDAILACERAMASVSDESGPGGALDAAQDALTQIGSLESDSPYLGSARECLENARIQLEEGRRELGRFRDTLDINPERQNAVEARLESIQALARKHKVLPSELHARHQSLVERLAGIEQRDQRLVELRQEAGALHGQWREAAAALGAVRGEAAGSLGRQVSERLHLLGLRDAVFEARLQRAADDQPQPGGAETVEFHVSMNPGQAPGPLSKIASGGELSRTGLAIRVITAARSATPTLVFDEVDSGVGGAVAEIVGRQLRELAAHCQVICVTHLPQVASQAQAHYQVSKQVEDGATRSSIRPLGEKERLEEVARMLGGVQISKQTRAHARELLKNAQLAAETESSCNG